MYTPPDPPGYFDGYVWPMYLKNRREMESMVSGIGESPVRDTVQIRVCGWDWVCDNWRMSLICSAFVSLVILDGLKPKEELLEAVCECVCEEMDRLRGKF